VPILEDIDNDSSIYWLEGEVGIDFAHKRSVTQVDYFTFGVFVLMSKNENNAINLDTNSQRLRSPYSLQNPKQYMTKCFWVTMPSRIESIQEVAKLLADSAHCIGAEKKVGFYLSIYDLLYKAVEHGGLGVVWYETQEALSAEEPMKIADDLRFTISDCKLKQVRIRFRSAPEYTECLICDGEIIFDWREENRCVFRPVDMESIRQRGLLTWLLDFDELDYEADGRAVRARKYTTI
jgi:hypothetical protein